MTRDDELDQDDELVPAAHFGRHSLDGQPERLQSVCAQCGNVYERDDNQARCHECLPIRTRRANHRYSKTSPKSRGYTAAWSRLSKRARRLQPWCLDCGSPDNLTADHSPQAWARQDAGLPIRLEDIDVVCRRCNSERGPARGPDAVERPGKQWPDESDELDAPALADGAHGAPAFTPRQGQVSDSPAIMD